MIFWKTRIQANETRIYTAKTQYPPKFETNIPRKGIARPLSQFPHSCVCERFIYSQDRPAYSAAGKYVDRSWGYINRSQTLECGNWGRGRAVPFRGIHNWNFHCTVSVLWQLSPGWIPPTPAWDPSAPATHGLNHCERELRRCRHYTVEHESAKERRYRQMLSGRSRTREPNKDRI